MSTWTSAGCSVSSLPSPPVSCCPWAAPRWCGSRARRTPSPTISVPSSSKTSSPAMISAAVSTPSRSTLRTASTASAPSGRTTTNTSTTIQSPTVRLLLATPSVVALDSPNHSRVVVSSSSNYNSNSRNRNRRNQPPPPPPPPHLVRLHRTQPNCSRVMISTRMSLKLLWVCSFRTIRRLRMRPMTTVLSSWLLESRLSANPLWVCSLTFPPSLSFSRTSLQLRSCTRQPSSGVPRMRAQLCWISALAPVPLV
mmetsp:Transcript_40791/g.102664  ORF Transcript_40791/g.102664 Transcript_40791/m.102664 type:complete len:253 (+) Transcript_40791:1110-1868(+)